MTKQLIFLFFGKRSITLCNVHDKTTYFFIFSVKYLNPNVMFMMKQLIFLFFGKRSITLCNVHDKTTYFLFFQ